MKGVKITAKKGFKPVTNWWCIPTIVNGIKVNSADTSMIMKIFLTKL